MTERKPTVFIIDDDPSVRKGLSRLVLAAGMRVESFGSAEEFLEQIHDDVYGCIVLDLQMPGMSGAELQEQLNRSPCWLPIIFLSAHGDVPTTAQTMKMGAVDFLTKPVDRDHLLKAIGESIAKSLENKNTTAAREKVRKRLALLTPREYEVMTFVIAGMLNKQIAYELGITLDTVKIHRGRMMTKMRAGSVAELVRLTEIVGIKPAAPTEQ